MTRFGLLPGEVVDFAKELVTLPNLRLEGIYTHFATSDESDKTFLHEQLAIYRETLEHFKEAGIEFSIRHAANSGAVLDEPVAHLDLVRCGITVYGLYPSDSVTRQVQLTPALSLKARVARVREVPAGTTVSYGRTFRTEASANLALVPVGYADGYSRALSNRGEVLVHGRRARIVGRVCMDQFVIDVTHVPEVRIGDEVVIIGKQGDQQVTADELAKLLGTINYEITSAIHSRVPRLYVRQGKVVASDSLVHSGEDEGLFV
jgi:alanine racemase